MIVSIMTEVNWKWEDFAPKIIQTDKRERENVAVKGIRMVKKKSCSYEEEVICQNPSNRL